MARVVGDGLKVNVARKPGEEQIIDLMALFNQNPNRIIVVAGTVGADGAPNTCPSHAHLRQGRKDPAGGHPEEQRHFRQPAPGRPGLPGNYRPGRPGHGHPGHHASGQGGHGRERRHGRVGDAGYQSQTGHLPGPAGDPGSGLGAQVGQGRSLRAGGVRRTQGWGLGPWERGPGADGPCPLSQTLSPNPIQGAGRGV